jgi:cytochrome c peroxidase
MPVKTRRAYWCVSLTPPVSVRSGLTRTGKAIPALALGFVLSGSAYAQTAATTQSGKLPASPGSLKLEEVVAPSAPAYFESHYRAALRAPLPAKVFKQTGIPPTISQLQIDSDGSGRIASFIPAGTVTTAKNAFFQSLGANGRSCFTCHQPASGMSVSLKDINQRFRRTDGHDPIFAPVDGATCPKNVPAHVTAGAQLEGRRGEGKGSLANAYKTLLGRGLIRVFVPVPIDADYTIEVVSDPYGCNTDPAFNQETDSTGKQRQLISVYRRPRISANLTFATATAIPAPASGNIMWDGREPSLESQAKDATLGHAQAPPPGPTDAQVAQIVAFEKGIFTAQSRTRTAHSLTDFALGGPVYLSFQTPGQRTPDQKPFQLYTSWLNLPKGFDRAAQRAAVARGEEIFNTKSFDVGNDAGLNTPPGQTGGAPNPLPNAHCSSCHSQRFSGNDSFPKAQQDQGIGGDSPNFGGPAPSQFLPVFRVTCKTGAPSGFHAASVTTNDPGLALISGKCADVGRFTVPQLRALAGHPPFFSDGSAATLLDVVNFYDKRFSIKFTPQEKQDLVAFMNSL